MVITPGRCCHSEMSYVCYWGCGVGGVGVRDCKERVGSRDFDG